MKARLRRGGITNQEIKWETSSDDEMLSRQSFAIEGFRVIFDAEAHPLWVSDEMRWSD
jgi:hypothetical protein